MTAPHAIAAVIARLARDLGPGGVLTGDDVTARSCDPFTHVPPASPALLRPQSTEDVARIMRLCHDARQPVVVHGGRTGVCGGAVAQENELVVSLERMRRIIDIDPVSATMTVEAGAAIEAVQDAAAAHGLFYPIDLGSKGTATIGGTIAANAGGNRVIRWGMTRQNVLGLEVVLADGTVLDLLNRFLKNNTGYDLKQLFIGSEGTLGVVCKAVLRLVPLPTTQQVALVSLNRYGDVLELLGRARTLQQLSAFEVMWQDYYATVATDPARRIVDPGAEFFVLIECMGHSKAADEEAFSALLEHALEDGLLVDAVVASSARQVDDIWRVREGSEILMREMGPFVSFDISVDIRRADEFVAAVNAGLATSLGGYRAVAFGHLGDGNIHIGVHTGPATLAHKHAIERCVYDVVRDFGGALTAEHGIGTAKREFLPDHITPAALATMRTVRHALDPGRLINRNVLFEG
ncbi:MAG: FAD-linked oxidase [Blastomonas sp. CACIA14H2]|uniref:FAD-binding oxidoreductase n=1 Tax=Blastomonas sp. CACIA14H2 TaxID=1419876 RepID=UPI0003CFC282|nr:MAG: FAD-linked oxidase [Blastomonas sp. CACIA14H2]